MDAYLASTICASGFVLPLPWLSSRQSQATSLVIGPELAQGASKNGVGFG
jgi:hypothetical protein